MKGLRAFVGHSFSEQDKALVSIFLEQLTTFQKTQAGFTWDHAEDAASARVPDKVLAKIEGKNVFIGICTKNERAVRDTSLKDHFWRKDRVSADRKDLQWKASDWIIQEIGLALGRNMRIVLLLEEEVREPGGLYGDLEYIRFSRENPYASFGRLLQMLSSISPPEVQASGSKAPVVEEKADVAEPVDDDDEDWEPQLNWTEEKYQHAMIRMIIDENQEGLGRVDAAFRSSKFAAGLGEVEWDGRIEWVRFATSKEADFEKLKKLSDEHPQSSVLRAFVARAYARFGEHENAAGAFEVAASTAADEDDKFSYKSDAAIQLARAGKMPHAVGLMEQLKQTAKENPELQSALMDDLRILAQLEKDATLEIAILEQMVELRPTDTTLRFQLAHKHSESGHEDMALHHYSKIPSPLRDSSTWNNLGVVYGHFKMHTKGVDAYRLAESEGETLAMSNMGFKLLGEGFLSEAKALVEKAMKIGNYHANIPDLLKHVTEVPEEENKKESETLEKVKAKATFYRQLGSAALIEAPTEIASDWKAPECALAATMKDQSVRIWGSYEEEWNSLALLVVGSGNLPKQKDVKRIEYVLKVRGNVLVGEVRRTTDGRQLGLLGELGSSVEMYFNADRSEIHVDLPLSFSSTRS